MRGLRPFLGQQCSGIRSPNSTQNETLGSLSGGMSKKWGHQSGALPAVSIWVPSHPLWSLNIREWYRHLPALLLSRLHLTVREYCKPTASPSAFLQRETHPGVRDRGRDFLKVDGKMEPERRSQQDRT